MSNTIRALPGKKPVDGGDGSCSAQMLLSQLLAARELMRFKQRLYNMDGHCLQV